MQLKDECVLFGEGVSTARRKCMFYSAEGENLDYSIAVFRFALEARLMVKADPAIEQLVTPSGMEAEHHGRRYRVMGLRHQYNNRGKCLYHIFQLRDVQG